MARIQIKDLTVDQTLDADALERVRGGLNFAYDLRNGNFDKSDVLWKYQGGELKIQDLNYLKLRGYDL